MKTRVAASVALSAVVLLGATGCTFITPQSTTVEYSASDGVNVLDFERPLEVRNVLIVANEDGTAGNLIAGIVNTTDADATLNIEIEGVEPLSLRVGAGDAISLGADAEPLLIENLGVMPGATVKAYFQAGDSTGRATDIPVLDGTLPYYSDLVPETSAFGDL